MSRGKVEGAGAAGVSGSASFSGGRGGAGRGVENVVLARLFV